MRRSLLIVVLIALLVIVISVDLHLRANNNNVTQAINRIPQNALVYLDPATENQPLLSSEAQQQLVNNYLEHYFTPWVDQRSHSPSLVKSLFANDDIKKAELEYIHQFTKYPGWDINQHRHDKDWMIGIANNMDLDIFPNHLHKAITINNADLRVLPTDDPSFGNLGKAGEGYPFDYVQESLVAANTPILVLQTTRDGAWDLVLTNADLGWVKTQDVANVDDKFIQEWQTGTYVALIKDHVPIFDDKQVFRFIGNIGALFPLGKSQNNQILIAVADVDRNAMIKTTEVDNQAAVLFPLNATPKNIAAVANNLLGVKYGWGDLLGYRDCSSTMMNLFTPFGVWLPRSSVDQAKAGSFTDLQNLSTKQKMQKIVSRGIPFLTLLHLPGHIVLYIGQRHNKAYILHDFWGLHTKNFFGREGRAIVGKTAITPLNFGEGYINVPKRLIDLVEGMAVLGGVKN